jgi:protein TonB
MFLLGLGLIVVLTIAALAWRSAQRTSAAVSSPAVAGTQDSSGSDILLGLAATATGEHRLIAPAGSNAFEFYLSVLQLDPGNAVARNALQQSMPLALDEVERNINDKQLDEAQRELRLLRDVDSNNYIVALLGGKLDAQRQLVVRADEARAAAMHAQAGLPR